MICCIQNVLPGCITCVSFLHTIWDLLVIRKTKNNMGKNTWQRQRRKFAWNTKKVYSIISIGTDIYRLISKYSPISADIKLFYLLINNKLHESWAQKMVKMRKMHEMLKKAISTLVTQIIRWLLVNNYIILLFISRNRIIAGRKYFEASVKLIYEYFHWDKCKTSKKYYIKTVLNV